MPEQLYRLSARQVSELSILSVNNDLAAFITSSLVLLEKLSIKFYLFDVLFNGARCIYSHGL